MSQRTNRETPWGQLQSKTNLGIAHIIGSDLFSLFHSGLNKKANSCAKEKSALHAIPQPGEREESDTAVGATMGLETS